ncbi:MAG: bifunctional hydroxymethylpyrimidine kinase/phosphomethylpyrimidine kinase [Alphaproteobacteria bacterium]|nr:bifunctional hydroxymethylpyrimidine kinase/phosphomethylpyrimidine kinase [Alphaproteobacteria bacterium]
MKKYKVALTIAGFDGSGGAGIQADTKTFSALGCYAMNILTSLPVQNTTGVKSIHKIPVDIIQKQAEAIFTDITPNVVKLGMLADSEVIKTIQDILKKFCKKTPIVLDPVMVAKSGHLLLDNNSIDDLKELILPLCKVITPNIFEAEVLSGIKIKNKENMLSSAIDILQYGSKYVILKGGHLDGEECPDLLISKNAKPLWFSSKKIKTRNLHGTGCTFSAAIASYIALGNDMTSSIRKTKKYISKAIESGSEYSIGKGHGPVNHFFKYWKD